MPKLPRPIGEIVQKLGLPPVYFEQIGPYGGKISLELLKDPEFPRKGKLILVTATTPTVSGEGKTVTSIGLTQGLSRIGKRAIITSREPSLGPVFGMKGGAAGGGASTLEPSAKINLHFHGDFHAISSAHNLLSALIDSHIFHGNELNLDPERISWPRAIDMNDRALRQIIVGLGSRRPGVEHRSSFVITAASEIMAIVALAKDQPGLRQQLGNILVGVSRTGKPIFARDLKAVGAMMALLAEAIQPNLVQTAEGTPALVHAGPFGNIAHGTSSIISQEIGLRLADYVVNEAGFAADLGAEKYIDIVFQSTGVSPAAAVLVTTVQSLKNQGEGDLELGLANLEQHLRILKRFDLPVLVAINQFPSDTQRELDRLSSYCTERSVPSSTHTSFANGGAGAERLARAVVDLIERNPNVEAQPVYRLSDSLLEKIEKVAVEVYGADGVVVAHEAQEKLDNFTKWGFGDLPVCIAKTQYSLTDNPKAYGAPRGWTLTITDAALSSGAGFVVAIAGNMMLMPGLPKAPRALEIDVDGQGHFVGV
ncbi:MAG: formate--tetrahydrofolate ligase [Candidatus Acidiferrum sp.]